MHCYFIVILYSTLGETYRVLSECNFTIFSQPAKGYSDESTVHEDVKEYYGKLLTKTADLKSNACMTVAKPVTSDIRKALEEVHPDVSDRYYGCGLAVPESLQGCRVLDLGCGSGQDCYMLSRLVGERGFVTGIDMTNEQLQVARKYIDYHAQRFGYRKPNTEFVQGYIEDLEDAGLKKGFYDIIISNCVVNLSPDKTSVLKQAHRVLKDGGELYFSDIYCNKDLPAEIRTHKVLWGECLAGALFWEDLMRLAGEVGFSTPRLVTATAVTVGNEELENLLGEYKFVSATYRLFKIPRGAPNTGCLVIYNGNITGFEDCLNFDAYHTFKVNAVVPVDGELASILRRSRFAEEFSFQPCLADQPSSSCVGPKTVTWNPFEVENLEASRPCCGVPKSCCK
uniref:Arsenite methyltransferase n=1 Tax=Paramormyrops kingsleyae TaxID=1676925 RepID=A0A3B3R7T2_9TELE